MDEVIGDGNKNRDSTKMNICIVVYLQRAKPPGTSAKGRVRAEAARLGDRERQLDLIRKGWISSQVHVDGSICERVVFGTTNEGARRNGPGHSGCALMRAERVRETSGDLVVDWTSHQEEREVGLVW